MRRATVILFLLSSAACRVATGVTVPLTIVNGLGGWSIHYVHLGSPSAKGWGQDLLGPSEIIRPGAERVFNVPPGTWNIRVIDSDGDTYTISDAGITETGFRWEVTLAAMDQDPPDSAPGTGGNCPVTILNSLGSRLSSLWISPAGSGDRGTNLIENTCVEPGSEFIAWVAPGGYDMVVVDGMGRTFAVYNGGVAESGFFWEVTEDYMER